MRKLILGLAVLFFATGAFAQSPDWRTRFDDEFTKARGRSFVEIEGKLYAFGWFLRQYSAQRGVYTFTRCGGTGWMRSLSPNSTDDAAILSKLKVISHGHTDYFRTEAQYDRECWSQEAWAGRKGSAI